MHAAGWQRRRASPAVPTQGRAPATHLHRSPCHHPRFGRHKAQVAALRSVCAAELLPPLSLAPPPTAYLSQGGQVAINFLVLTGLRASRGGHVSTHG
jgi:hypothetical protein